MSEYSMPSYFQSMPVIGKDLSAFHEDNAAEIQAVEQEIHEIREAALEAGKSTEALNESGQWTAMQRIMELVDEGTWCPLNSLYNPRTTRTAALASSRASAVSTANGPSSSRATTRSSPAPGSPARPTACCAAATRPSACASPRVRAELLRR